MSPGAWGGIPVLLPIGSDVPELSVKSIWATVLLKSAASSLIFCPGDLLPVKVVYASSLLLNGSPFLPSVLLIFASYSQTRQRTHVRVRTHVHVIWYFFLHYSIFNC